MQLPWLFFIPIIGAISHGYSKEHTRKCLVLSTGHTYQYIRVEPQGNQPNILFLHGFPSLAEEWYHQIDHFSSLGYGVIAPDLLGYGGSDRPEEVSAYSLKAISGEVAEILQHEQISVVHGVSHDFGSNLMSKMAVYHPEYFKTLSFLTVGYQAPGAALDVDAVNAATEEMFGYAVAGYFNFFNASGAAELANSHLRSIHSLAYSADPLDWRYHLGPIDALESWLRVDNQTDFGSWYSKEDQIRHEQEFSKEGGYIGPMNWYKGIVRNIDLEAEKEIPSEAIALKVPVLLLTAGKDPLVLPELQVQGTTPYASNLTIKEIDAAHWIQLEQPQQVNAALEGFLDSNLGN